MRRQWSSTVRKLRVVFLYAIFLVQFDFRAFEKKELERTRRERERERERESSDLKVGKRKVNVSNL